MAAHPSILALGNPRERGAWWATVHGVTKSWAQLCKHTDACKLLCVEWINKKALLYGTGNYIQYPVIKHNGKEYEKQCVCTHTHTHTHKTESILCMLET